MRRYVFSEVFYSSSGKIVVIDGIYRLYSLFARLVTDLVWKIDFVNGKIPAMQIPICSSFVNAEIIFVDSRSNGVPIS